ncbi:MAG: extracellular solute-binding protein [Lachnospiraceae bacterium]|jgi:oligogalacturonide transport system substrate-binding protein|nr:extracellular solute-binding protein [Lachnospiraceae bacterium]
MKRNKILAAIVGMVMLVATLAACGGGGATQTTAAPSAVDTQAVTTAAPAPAATTAAPAPAAAPETQAPATEAATDPAALTTDNITLTISWWGGESRAEATQKAIDAFMKKYPNIKVESTFSAWTGWEDTMGLAFASDTAQDVVQINWNWIYNFGANGNVFVNLYDYQDVLDVKQFPESALKASELDGKLQGIPVAMTARTMFWNKNTFDKAGVAIPTTWDDMLASGEAFKAALGDDYYPFMLTEYDRIIFMVYYLESLYNKPWVVDNKVNYTEEEIAEGFAMFTELEDKHVIPTIQMVKEFSADPLDQSERWINGYWAGVHTWNTSNAPLKASLPEDQQAGFVAGPMFDGLPYKGGLNKISMEFAVTQTCKHPKEAAALINFMLNEEEGVVAMAGERGVPASAAAFAIAERDSIVDQLTIDATNYALNEGWNQFPLDAYFEHNDLKNNPEGAYYKIFSAHSYKSISDAEAAKQLVEAINTVMAAQ